MKQRVPYFDVAKGILMLMIIYGHCMNWNRDFVMDKDIIVLSPIQNIWQSFFMPAFFVITGICSNFNRSFKDFFLRNFKSLLIPCWFFTILDPFDLPNIHIKKAFVEILLYGGNSVFWFIPALFFSKMIYWCLRNCPPHRIISHRIVVLGILLVMAISSTLLNEKGFPNYYYILQVCNLTIYLFIGEQLKVYIEKNWMMETLLLVYLIIIGYIFYLDYNVPAVTHAFNCSISQYPLYLLLSVLGSISILELSRWVNSNIILELIGRGSLVVFIFQSYFLVNFMNIYKESFLAHGFIGSLFLLLSTIVMDVVFCVSMNWLLNRKYLKWILGKF